MCVDKCSKFQLKGDQSIMSHLKYLIYIFLYFLFSFFKEFPYSNCIIDTHSTEQTSKSKWKVNGR